MDNAPLELRYHRARRELRVRFADADYLLGAEFLRVHSPSAEVQGHGGVGGQLPRGKQDVAITGIEPVGRYAVRLVFSDGHVSGLYTWDWLRHLGANQADLDAAYRQAVAAAPSAPGAVTPHSP
ncbi:MAG: gamma-butyrobetaine hydroxylase-like domain-containing protein [Moraxellaceae bacterium]